MNWFQCVEWQSLVSIGTRHPTFFRGGCN